MSIATRSGSTCDFQLGLAVLFLGICGADCFAELPEGGDGRENRAIVMRDGVDCLEVDRESDVPELVSTGVEVPELDSEPEGDCRADCMVLVFFFRGRDRMSSIKA